MYLTKGNNFTLNVYHNNYEKTKSVVNITMLRLNKTYTYSKKCNTLILKYHSIIAIHMHN